MVSQIKVNEIIKQSGSSITIGESGDTIDLTGNVGIGTSSPDYKFEIETSDNAIANFKSTDANSNIRFTDSDSTANGYAGIGAVGDDLTLIAGNENRLRVRSNGVVLIGTISSSNGQLQVEGDTTNSFRGYFANSTANFQNMRLYSDVGGTETETFRIENDGDVKNTNNSYGSLSDKRIKQNITDANSQWEDIKALKIKNFKRIDQVNAGLDNKMIGVIAQDLEEAGMSGLVKESIPSTGEIRANEVFGTIEEKKVYYDKDDNEVQNGEKTINDVKKTVLEEKLSGETVKSVKYSILYMKAIKALQEAMEKIETLEAKVAALESK